MTQKILQITREKMGMAPDVRNNAAKSDFRVPTVQMFVFLPHQKLMLIKLET
jgi:hypothetical protein